MKPKNTYISKLKRTLTSLFPVAKSRHGVCINCGKCCNLPNRCVFFKTTKNGGYCTVYSLRPLVCRKYPRTNSEHIYIEGCGYDFGGK